MSDTPSSPNSGGNKFLIEFGPVAIFVVAYHYLRRSDPDGAIFTAAGIFMVVAVIALAYSRIKLGKFSGVLLLTTAIIVVTVGLSLLSGNPIFLYMKPTVINALFGIAVLGGVMLKKNVLKLLLGEAFSLPDKAWNTLAIRWGIFFFVLAAMNEFIWRNFSEEFWVNFKLFGFFPITLLFTFSQIPFIMKYGTVKGQDG